MPAPEPRAGYRASQKLLHWLTVLAVAAQLLAAHLSTNLRPAILRRML